MREKSLTLVGEDSIHTHTHTYIYIYIYILRERFSFV